MTLSRRVACTSTKGIMLTNRSKSDSSYLDGGLVKRGGPLVGVVAEAGPALPGRDGIHLTPAGPPAARLPEHGRAGTPRNPHHYRLVHRAHCPATTQTNTRTHDTASVGVSARRSCLSVCVLPYRTTCT
jgi:hypothetical protein